MKSIQIEEKQFRYFSPHESVPQTNSDGEPIAHSDFAHFLQARLKYKAEFRPLVYSGQLLDNPIEMLYCIFWPEQANLDELDSKVLNNTATEKDFEQTILTRCQITVCTLCNHEAITLVHDTDCEIPFFSLRYSYSPNRQSTDRLISKYWQECPVCYQPFRIAVVRVFKETTGLSPNIFFKNRHLLSQTEPIMPLLRNSLENFDADRTLALLARVVASGESKFLPETMSIIPPEAIDIGRQIQERIDHELHHDEANWSLYRIKSRIDHLLREAKTP